MKGYIVIPTYNEKENIEKTIAEVSTVLDNVVSSDFGILIVDDSSPDGTANIVEKIIPNNQRVSLHVRKAKEGLGAAYLDGIDVAFSKLGAEAVIQFDADLSHPPEKLPQMIKHLENGVDVVIGTRYRPGGAVPSNWAWYRKLLSIGGNLFVRLVFMENRVTDWTAGFKGINKETFYRCKERVEGMNGYIFQCSFTKSALDIGASVAEVPYKFVDRVYGKSKMGPDYIKDMLKFVVLTRLNELIKGRFGKVFIAGGIGSVAQLSSYALFIRHLFVTLNVLNLPEKLDIAVIHLLPPVNFATFVAIEVGIVSTFLVNNFWAFNDHKKSNFSSLAKGLIKVNMVASGAIVIQLVIVGVGTAVFGSTLFVDLLFQGFGILVGLIWNYYFYKKFVWRTT